MKKMWFSVGLFALLCSCGTKSLLDGSFRGAYLGEVPASDSAKIFAPGVISTGLFTRDMVMMPDGSEIYFSVSLPNYSLATIVYTKQSGNRWSKPEIADFASNTKYDFIEPAISPDGKKFYFVSTMPSDRQGEAMKDRNIWVMERSGDSWGVPYEIGEPVNSDTSEYFPSVTKDGTIYFTRDLPSGPSAIYRSKRVNGKYETPVRLPVQVNSGLSAFNAFADPDDQYLIVPVYGREDSYGSTDYYIVFHEADDRWSEPQNLGAAINTSGGMEYAPYISPDKKYFFFMSARFSRTDILKKGNLSFSGLQKLLTEPGNGNPSIWWISTSFLDKLRKE